MYFSTKLLFKLKIDDVVGAIPAHLVAGVWGTLAVPLTNGDFFWGSIPRNYLSSCIRIRSFVYCFPIIKIQLD